MSIRKNLPCCCPEPAIATTFLKGKLSFFILSNNKSRAATHTSPRSKKEKEKKDIKKEKEKRDEEARYNCRRRESETIVMFKSSSLSYKIKG